MKISIGIDPSLAKTAVCVLAGDTHTLKVFGRESSHTDLRTRLRNANELTEAILSWLNSIGVDAASRTSASVCLEGYSHASRFHAHQLGEFGGLLRCRLLDEFANVYEVAPLTLKKWATGKGKGDKTPMIAAMAKRYGVEFETDDAYDAYALARLCQQLTGHTTPANEAQREAIETVVNGAEKKEKKPRKAKAK